MRLASEPQNQDENRRLAREKLLRQVEEQGIKPLDLETLRAMGRVWPEDEVVDDFLRAREHWRRQSVNRGAIP